MWYNSIQNAWKMKKIVVHSALCIMTSFRETQNACDALKSNKKLLIPGLKLNSGSTKGTSYCLECE